MGGPSNIIDQKNTGYIKSTEDPESPVVFDLQPLNF
jgi:hypothetical protein